MIVLLIMAIGSAVYAVGSWENISQGTAMLIVDTSSRSVSDPIYGPASGFMLNGFAHLFGTQYPIYVYYATDVYEDTIPCFSKDQLEMNITVQMRWQLDLDKLKDLYSSYPRMDYEATAIDSIMERELRFLTKDYTSVETIASREELSNRIQSKVFAELEATPSLKGALSHLEFDLKNIEYPPAYKASIEAKLVEEQRKIQAEFERDRILILANATAQENIIKAEGIAQAKVIESHSVEESLKILTAAYPDINVTRILEYYEKQLWLNTLTNLNVPVIIVGVDNNGMPFILDMPTN